MFLRKHVHWEEEGAIQKTLQFCFNITESIATWEDFSCAFAMVVSNKDLFFQNFVGEIDVILPEVEQQPLEVILILPKRNSQITTIAESIFHPSCYTTICSFNHDRNPPCYALYPLKLVFYTFGSAFLYFCHWHKFPRHVTSRLWRTYDEDMCGLIRTRKCRSTN